MHHHLRDQVLVHLKLTDLLTELGALFCIVDGGFFGGAGETQRAGSAVEPGLIQLPHANFEAISLSAETITDR
jgi:hypothetical protein